MQSPWSRSSPAFLSLPPSPSPPPPPFPKLPTRLRRTGNTRVGLSGAELPSEVFATQVEAGNDTDGVLMPIKRGVVDDWGGVERLWELLYRKVGPCAQVSHVWGLQCVMGRWHWRRRRRSVLFDKGPGIIVLGLESNVRAFAVVLEPIYGRVRYLL